MSGFNKTLVLFFVLASSQSALAVDLSGIWEQEDGSTYRVMQNKKWADFTFLSPSNEAENVYGFKSGDLRLILTKGNLEGRLMLNFPLSTREHCPDKWRKSIPIKLSLSTDGNILEGKHLQEYLHLDCDITSKGEERVIRFTKNINKTGASINAELNSCSAPEPQSDLSKWWEEFKTHQKNQSWSIWRETIEAYEIWSAVGEGVDEGKWILTSKITKDEYVQAKANNALDNLGEYGPITDKFAEVGIGAAKLAVKALFKCESDEEFLLNELVDHSVDEVEEHLNQPTSGNLEMLMMGSLDPGMLMWLYSIDDVAKIAWQSLNPGTQSIVKDLFKSGLRKAAKQTLLDNVDKTKLTEEQKQKIAELVRQARADNPDFSDMSNEARHDAYLKWILGEGNTGKPSDWQKRFNPYNSDSKKFTRLLDYYDKETGIGYEINTSEWGNSDYIDSKLGQAEKDRRILENLTKPPGISEDPYVSKIIWIMSNPLPEEGKGGQLRRFLEETPGIEIWIRPMPNISGN